ncbi:MAG: hypothetical protein WC052_04790 [Patescibacteria group bacterium]|jgi:hypothetical protein
MPQENNKSLRDDSLQAASEGAIESTARDLIDGATISICRYVNTTAGDVIVANPDLAIRSKLLDLLVAYEERKKA